MDYNKELREAWKDHPDPSGFLKAAHSPENCLLIWWYNPFTGEFRKTKNPDASHSDDNILLTSEELPLWIRGRIFKFRTEIYLMLYIFGRKIINVNFLNDLFDLASRSINEPITQVIDNNGDDLKYLFESWKSWDKYKNLVESITKDTNKIIKKFN